MSSGSMTYFDPITKQQQTITMSDLFREKAIPEPAPEDSKLFNTDTSKGWISDNTGYARSKSSDEIEMQLDQLDQLAQTEQGLADLEQPQETNDIEAQLDQMDEMKKPLPEGIGENLVDVLEGAAKRFESGVKRGLVGAGGLVQFAAEHPIVSSGMTAGPSGAIAGLIQSLTESPKSVKAQTELGKYISEYWRNKSAELIEGQPEAESAFFDKNGKWNPNASALSNPDWWINGLSDTLGGLAPLLTGPAAPVVFAGSAMGESYDKLRASGMSENEAGARSMAVGGITMALMEAGIGKMFKNVEKSMLKRIIANSLTNATIIPGTSAGTVLAEELGKEGWELPDVLKTIMDAGSAALQALPQALPWIGLGVATGIKTPTTKGGTFRVPDKTEPQVSEKATVSKEPPPIRSELKETANAIQEQGASGILQPTQEGIGGTGSERGRVEPSQQGQEVTQTQTGEGIQEGQRVTVNFNGVEKEGVVIGTREDGRLRVKADDGTVMLPQSDQVQIVKPQEPPVVAETSPVPKAGAEALAPAQKQRQSNEVQKEIDDLETQMVNKYGKDYFNDAIAYEVSKSQPSYRYIGPERDASYIKLLEDKSSSAISIQLRDIRNAMRSGESFKNAVSRTSPATAEALGGKITEVLIPKTNETVEAIKSKYGKDVEKLDKLEQLYEERNRADDIDIQTFVDSVLEKTMLNRGEAAKAIAVALNIKKGTHSEYLYQFDKHTTSILDTLYTHFADGTGTAEFRWGGTGENPKIEVSFFNEDGRPMEVNADAMRKTVALYDAMAATKGSLPLREMAGFTPSVTKQISTPSQKDVAAPAVVPSTERAAKGESPESGKPEPIINAGTTSSETGSFVRIKGVSNSKKLWKVVKKDGEYVDLQEVDTSGIPIKGSTRTETIKDINLTTLPEPKSVREKVAEKAKQPVTPDTAKVASDVAKEMGLTKAEPRESGKSGFLALPDSFNSTKIKVAIKQFKDKFLSGHGLSKEANTALDQFNADITAIGERNRRWRITTNDLEKQLVKSGLSKEDAATAIREVVHGESKASDLATAFKIPETNEGIKSLQEFETTRNAAAKNLGVFLRQSGHAELAKVIEENPAYVTRAYRLFEQKVFKPSESARTASTTSIKTGFTERLGKIERVAQKMTTLKGQPSGLDVVKFMESKGPTLEGIPNEMSNSRVKRLLTLRDAYRQLRDITNPVEVDAKTGEVKVRVNDRMLEDAANSIVDELLNRPESERSNGQSYAINHLKKRVLGDVFRDLYGEIKEPINEMMRTAEVQGRLLAGQTLMDTIANLPETSSKLRLTEKGFTTQLPSDSKKFGALAGKYVHPNLAYLLKVQTDPASGFVKLYRKALSGMRMGSLLNHKSMARNAATSITGQGLQTGELIESPQYAKELVKATKLLTQYAAHNVDAMRKVEEYAKNRVFQIGGGTSAAQDLMAWTSGGNLREKAGSVYSSMDFPAQIASYEYQTKTKGKTHEQAIDWLNEYYQRAHTTPIVARWLSQNTPISDFMGYTAQTIRMTKNAAKLGVKELKKGNPVPLMGFIASHALGLAYITGQEELLRRGAINIVNKMKNDNAEETSKEQNTALGNFMPSYWKVTPKYTWRSTVDGKPVLRTVILGGQTAWPLDDMIAGIYSYIKNTPNLDKEDKLDVILNQSLGQLFDPNMLVASGVQALTGKSFDKNAPEKPGLMDMFAKGPIESISDPAGRKVLKDIALDLGGRFIPYGRYASQLASSIEREKAGQKPLAGQKTSDEIAHNMLSFIRVETYDKDRALLAINQRLSNIANKEYFKTMTESKGAVSTAKKATKERGAATETQIELSEAGKKRREEMLEEMRETFQRALIAFEPIGISGDDLAGIKIEVQGLSKSEIGYIKGRRDKIPAYIPKTK